MHKLMEPESVSKRVKWSRDDRRRSDDQFWLSRGVVQHEILQRAKEECDQHRARFVSARENLAKAFANRPEMTFSSTYVDMLKGYDEFVLEIPSRWKERPGPDTVLWLLSGEEGRKLYGTTPYVRIVKRVTRNPYGRVAWYVYNQHTCIGVREVRTRRLLDSEVISFGDRMLVCMGIRGNEWGGVTTDDYRDAMEYVLNPNLQIPPPTIVCCL